MRLKSIAAALIIALMALWCAAAAEDAATPPHAAEEGTLGLTVFLFDKCGGCGVDSPGCGDCKEIVKYHGIIKGILGDRLYDGTFHYTMNNCRLEANDKLYDEYFEAYGVPEELYGHRPATFIGTTEGGIYLIGEGLLNYVDVYLDKYLQGDDIGAIQAEIDKQREELILQQTAAAQ